MQSVPRAYTMSMWLPTPVTTAATKPAVAATKPAVAATKPAVAATKRVSYLAASTVKPDSYLATKYPGKWLCDLTCEQYFDVIAHDPELRARHEERVAKNAENDYS